MKIKEAKYLIKLSRQSILSVFEKTNIKIDSESEKKGVFITLYTYPKKQLRGCIGFPYPEMPLYQAVAKAARHSAFSDPRFLPLSKNELNSIIIEVSVLTVPKLIKPKNSEDLINKIKIGKDGLIIEKEGNSGLLLPQVAKEYCFSKQEFLEQVCLKAGLSKDSWKSKDVKIYKFQAEIFVEEKPNSKVIKKS